MPSPLSGTEQFDYEGIARREAERKETMMNPNEYDDDAYTRASNETISAIEAEWESGVELDTIEQDIALGLENAGLKVIVSITFSHAVNT